MRHIIWTLLLSMLVLNAEAATDLPFTEIEDMDGTRVAVYIKEHELESAPQWEPGEGAIPVSVEQAIGAVTAWAKEQKPNQGQLIFSELVLKQIRGSNNKQYWHYLVRYHETLEDGSVSPKESVAAVLLDGGVLPVIELPSN